MSQSKTIKMNLKNLIADLVFAYTDKNEEEINVLKKGFESMYNIQTCIMQSNIIKYILDNKIVQDDIKLTKYFKSFLKSK